jgi:hypothetical protein
MLLSLLIMSATLCHLLSLIPSLSSLLSYQMLIGKWQSSDLADKDNFNRLKLLLQKTVTFVATFKSDPDALWVLVPLLHLVSEILYTMAFYLLPAPSRNTQPKFLLDGDGTGSGSGSDDTGNSNRGICSEVMATDSSKTPETWKVEPTQPTQGPIVKGSDIPFYLISDSTGQSLLTNQDL